MGTPKYAIPFGNETLLERTIRIVSEVCSPIVVVAAADQDLSHLQNSGKTEVLLTKDEWPGEGPLSGFLTGLKQLPEETEAIFLCGCDTPLLKSRLITFLADQLDDLEAVVPVDAEHGYPLHTIYRKEVQPVLEIMRQNGERKMQHLLQKLNTREVPLSMLALVDSQLESFQNINTPADLDTALKTAGLSSSSSTSRDQASPSD